MVKKWNNCYQITARFESLKIKVHFELMDNEYWNLNSEC